MKSLIDWSDYCCGFLDLGLAPLVLFTEVLFVNVLFLEVVFICCAILIKMSSIEVFIVEKCFIRCSSSICYSLSCPPMSCSPMSCPPMKCLSLSADPRVADWFMMQSPIPTIILVILYLVIVYIGPKLMKNREPFDLKPILIVYNSSLVALSAYIVFEVCACVCVCVCVCVCCVCVCVCVQYNVHCLFNSWWMDHFALDTTTSVNLCLTPLIRTTSE